MGSKPVRRSKKYGEIVDISFPDIKPEYDDELLKSLARQYISEIVSKKPQAVMVQGDFTFTFMVVTELIHQGIQVLAACTKRQAKVTVENGETKKMSIFKFEKFKKYNMLGDDVQ